MDNLPTVLMEAMAAALPCVSTRLAGVPEMVVDGKTGLLVPEKSPVALAGALQQVLTSPELAHQFGQAGLLRARKLFDQSTTAKALVRALFCRGKLNPSPAWFLKDPLLPFYKIRR